jgi:hypothetical protein
MKNDLASRLTIRAFPRFTRSAAGLEHGRNTAERGAPQMAWAGYEVGPI